jgi:microcystin-dependent protein
MSANQQTQAYVGELRIFGGIFAPVGWNFCDGSLLPINLNEALFQLIGTTYGGDGVNTFALPDLRGRLPFHQGTGLGTNFIIGQLAGSETVTLTTQQLPSHSHQATCNNDATGTSNPKDALWLNWGSNQYIDQPLTSTMPTGAMTQNGGNQPHDNLMPFLTVNFIIALEGIFPSQG